MGLLLGLAGLTKGPAGPIIFYLTIIPYLIWQHRVGRLFTVGHALCLALALAPAGIWVGLLFDRGVIGLADLVLLWSREVRAVPAEGYAPAPGEVTGRWLAHYTRFGPNVFGMFFPGILWVMFGMWRMRRRALGDLQQVQRFLVCGVVVPFVVFYLHPEARPRHLMPAFFPAAVLAGVVAAAPVDWPRWRDGLARALSIAPLAVGTVGIVIALAVYPSGVVEAVAVFAVTMAASVGLWRLTHCSTEDGSAIALAANMTAACLTAWFVANAIVFPWRAPFSATRMARQKLIGRLSADEEVYTTRTFPATAEGYYNLQFHLARHLKAAPDLMVLARSVPCVAVVTPSERSALEGEGFAVEEVARVASAGGPPEVHVVRIGPPRRE